MGTDDKSHSMVLSFSVDIEAMQAIYQNSIEREVTIGDALVRFEVYNIPEMEDVEYWKRRVSSLEEQLGNYQHTIDSLNEKLKEANDTYYALVAKYPPTDEEIEIRGLVAPYFSSGEKIRAVKAIRERTALGLKEALEIVNKVWRELEEKMGDKGELK